MKNSFILSAVAVLLALSACVPQQRFAEQEQTLQYYKTESLTADSLRAANESLRTDKELNDQEYRETMRELERLTATNISLNRSYQEVVSRYNELVTQNQETLNASSSENLNLQQEIAARQAEIENKERMLNQLELQLQAREQELQRLEGGLAARTPGANAYDYAPATRAPQTPAYTQPAGYTQPAAAATTPAPTLDARMAALEERRFNLRTDLQRVLFGFGPNEVAVTEKGGNVYLSLYQGLLAAQPGEQVDWRWRQALQQISTVIQRYPDYVVTVEGHTFAEGMADRSWDLSVTRAANVVKTLIAYGADPRRLTASGRGMYAPVANNDSPENQALNQRTEIIFAPNWVELYPKLLGR